MKEIFGIVWFSSKNIFFLVPTVILLIFLLVKLYKWKKNAINKLTLNKYNFLLKNFSLKRTFVKLLFLFFAIFFLSISLLQPQWGNKELIVSQQGRDLLIALDVSASMLAQDIEPNRLEFAKKKIRDLVGKLRSERIGLILFSSEAFLQCPLTTDFGTFFTFLDSLDTETISSSSTSLNSAIRKAIDIYKEMSTRKNKLLVIFTDGEDFSNNGYKIKEESQKINLKIFTFGIGTPEGAPIPVYNNEGKQEGFLKDKNMSVVITRLDEPALKALSEQTGAFYIRSQSSSADVDLFIRKIRSFEKEKFEDKQFLGLQDRYYYFAFLSLICLIFNWIL